LGEAKVSSRKVSLIDDEKQMDLFEVTDVQNLKKEPRDKNIPAEGTKQTNASASAFGWQFQIIVGIILSLENIKNLNEVKIEGNTEDVELYLNDRKPVYVQVKSIQKKIYDVKDSTKITAAMNTLINTSNITNGGYSELIYIANFRNPLNLDDALMQASWIPEMNKTFIRTYESLPEKAKQFVQERIEMAQRQLEEKYTSSIENFDLRRLRIGTILFGSDSQDAQQYSVLEGTIKYFFELVKLEKVITKVDRVKNMLITHYLSNAGTQDTTEKKRRITKESLIWRIIFEIIDDVPESFFENAPAGTRGELETYENDFIKQQVERIEIINGIQKGLMRYAGGKLITSKICEKFVKEEWDKYLDIFPIDHEDKIIQEYGIKLIMTRIINGKRLIEKIEEGVNMK